MCRISACLMTATAITSAGWTADDKSEAGRRLDKEVVVAASVEQVWERWATAEGAVRFGPKQAKVELKPGGMFEWYFQPDAPEGQRGAEGCKVLSYIPTEMLAFTWNAPPSIPELRNAGARTQVVVRLTPAEEGKTRVRLVQLGFGQGEAWDKYYAYFDRAWGHVLDSLVKSFASSSHSSAGSARPAAAAKRRSWVDGDVTVTAIEGDEKRQEFELTIPATVETVWSALATTDGARKTFAPSAIIELEPGGSYGIWPDSSNQVLAFVPHEMLSVSGSAPPQFPNVRKGGTWSMYTFDRDGPSAMRLRLVAVGWKPGDAEHDAAFDYFLKNNALFLNSLRKKLSAAER